MDKVEELKSFEQGHLQITDVPVCFLLSLPGMTYRKDMVLHFLMISVQIIDENRDNDDICGKQQKD